jgi:PAS domain S-box-containing protein
MDQSEWRLAFLSIEGRYRLLVEAITDYAIYMLDPDGLVSSWNPGAKRFKGYEAHEIVGQHFSCFYTDEDRNSGLPARALEIARHTGKFENEGWRVRKDGTQFWAFVVIDSIRSDSGEIIGFAKITRDLTDRKKADETLQKSEQQFRLLVQGVTDYAIYMLDPEGIVSSWNLGAERIGAVFYYEGTRKGHGAWPANGLRPRATIRWALRFEKRTGKRDHGGTLVAHRRKRER